jgi:hypothetical protein
MDGRFVANGIVIADGYGVDRSLVLTNFASVNNTIENTTSNGWFAIRRGRLLLPPLGVPAGSSTICWGEAIGDRTNDLVNSIRMDFTDVGGGLLGGGLLAVDRADAHVTSTNALGVWDITAAGLAFGSGTAVLTFRYDDGLAAAIGCGQDKLKVWRKYDTGWTEVTSVVNTNARLITTRPQGSFSLYAVSPDVPGPVATGSQLQVR